MAEDEKEARVIVKIQISLASSDGQSWAMIYDQSKTRIAQFEPPKLLLDIMKGRPKAFFYAILVNDKFVIEEEAPWQEW